MDLNRGFRPNQPAGVPANNPAGAATQNTQASPSNLGNLSNNRIKVALAGLAVLLLIGVGAFFLLGSKDGQGVLGASNTTNSSKMQAVFLNGGQVYFGKITNLEGDSLRLEGIYYLRVNQQVQPNQQSTQQSNDISLVKLGCELHGPEDFMVINKDQVIFWENLKAEGQVAKAVAEYQKNNPEGQKCEENAQQPTQQTGQNADPTTQPQTNTTQPSTNGTNPRP